MNPRRSSPKDLLPVLAALAAFAAAPAGATISGVCPDGSMFIVKKESDIPCPRARRVDPHDMPPIRPHYLPRPYGWELHHRQQDPNNPYNLVEDANTMRAHQQDEADAPQRLGGPAPSRPAPQHAGPPAPQQASPQPAGPLPPVAAAPLAAEPLALSGDETRNLGLIVELTQDRIPARFGRGDPPTLTLDLAHSRAFAARVGDWYAGESLGPVVLFKATAVAPEEFHANLTFVQGHHAFTPDRRDPRSFGLLDGTLGAQPAGGVVLGYAVLPEGVDLTRPVDVYWNDRRISVVLQP
jgi:hypothetical protein